uniref:Uncharacterized protein n=1 Tax=Micrurus carvalhoi TaxID=3147026 RepID=A0A2H6N961_9SAUR
MLAVAVTAVCKDAQNDQGMRVAANTYIRFLRFPEEKNMVISKEKKGGRVERMPKNVEVWNESLGFYRTSVEIFFKLLGNAVQRFSELNSYGMSFSKLYHKNRSIVLLYW